MLRQFEFHIIKGKRVYSVFCTAQSQAKALAAVDAAYLPEFCINSLPVAVHAAHHFYAEIDAAE